MRIAHLLPGTGSFHCGTCLRDHALLTALRLRGHEVVVVPMYLPSFPDEVPAAVPVQMGALNLYLQHHASWWRKLPQWLRDRLDSPRLLRWLSRRGGNTDPHKLGAMTVAMLQGEQGPFAAEIERLGAWFRQQEPFDVIALSNVLLVGVARSLRQGGARIACTLQGETSFLDELPEPHRGRAYELLRERGAELDVLVAVSRHYQEVMQARLQLPPERVHVVHNGLLFAAAEMLPPSAAMPTIGYLARMCVQKGLPLLVDAFLRLHADGTVPGLRLGIAGVVRGEDRPLVAQLQAKLQAAGAGDAVSWHPNLDGAEKQAFLRSLSVFSVPADRGEAFGLYVLEAMAAGVPVVAPAHAAFPELLAHGGGVLCAADGAALAQALGGLLRDRAKARLLGLDGQRAVREHFTAARMAAAVEAVYATVAPAGRLRA